MATDGDGWTRCDRGHRHWGRHGAAGLLLRHVDSAGRRWVLLQHRAWWSHHGGTWGVPGGARKANETPEQAALRETVEEVDIDLTGVRLLDVHSDDHGGWAYTTVLAESPELLSVSVSAEESTDARWFLVEQVASLTLHPGFAASWPLLATR
jgi:8-oxo-dGTP diphosphatase